MKSTRILYTLRQTQIARSRRRKEADGSSSAIFPPPYAGSYETSENIH
jgi:hypothetical protein